MKRFNGVKDYWELRDGRYEYNGPEIEEERYWIKEEFKEALRNEAKKARAKGIGKKVSIILRKLKSLIRF